MKKSTPMLAVSVLGATLMTGGAQAQDVQRDCKEDAWPIYSTICGGGQHGGAPHGDLLQRGGTYGQ